MRKRRAVKRDVLPDPIYKSKVVTKLVNRIMIDGKKGKAETILYEAFDIIKEKTNDDPSVATSKNSWVNCTMWYEYYDKDNIDMLLSGNSGYKFSYDYNLLSKVQFSNAGLVSSFIDYTNTIGNSFDENTEVYANGYANDFKYDKYGRLIFCRLRNNNTNLTNNSLRFIYSDKEANQLTGYETDDELKMYSNSSSKLRMVKDENNNRRKYVYNDNGLLSSIVSESMNDTSLINYEYDEKKLSEVSNIIDSIFCGMNPFFIDYGKDAIEKG